MVVGPSEGYMASKLIETLQSGDASLCRHEAERMALAAATRAFLARVEKPSERLIDLSLNQPTLNATLKVAMDVQMFPKWAGMGEKSMSCRRLAEICGIEERLMRMTAMNECTI